MALIIPYHERAEPLPRMLGMTIIAQDPSVKGPDGAMLRACARVPAEPLTPGPRGPRFHVVDYDVTHRRFFLPAELTRRPKDRNRPDWTPPSMPRWDYHDRFEKVSDRTLLSNPAFRAQNVYAIAARTLAAFQFALGRPVPWSFPNHHLHLVPAAFAETNAYYAEEDQALYFGYVPRRRRDQTVYTCLSHDVVAHETTHAILDGLRSRYDAPGLPDQPAFHEGLADIVALLSVFSIREVVQNLLGKPNRQRISTTDVSEERLMETALLKLAEQFGDEVHQERGGALRESVKLDPTTEWRKEGNRVWEEPHRRGEILVAAVAQTLVKIWRSRLDALIQGGTLDRVRAAEEGSTAAQHLLTMMIRAIDYCPPIEFEFEDFLDAVLVSDAEISPDDPYEYRECLKDAFARFGIEQPNPQPRDRWPAMDRPTYQNFNFAALRSDPSEVYRFIWENTRYLTLDPSYHLRVEDVRPSIRLGPDGFVVNETVADFVQQLEATKAELLALGIPDFEVPAEVPDDAEIKLWGGGTIIFDQFGGVKYVQTKPLADGKRQSRRLRYLVRRGLWDRRKRLGFSFGTPLGQRFAQFHRSESTSAEEGW